MEWMIISIQVTLTSKESTEKKEKKIEKDIHNLEEYILNELENIDENTDLGLLVSHLMYKILLFHLEDYKLDEGIVRKECSKYAQMDSDKLLLNVP